MVIVMVGKENDTYLTHVCAGPRQPPCYPVASIHNVVGLIYGKQMGRLCPAWRQRRASRSAQCNQ